MYRNSWITQLSAMYIGRIRTKVIFRHVCIHAHTLLAFQFTISTAHPFWTTYACENVHKHNCKACIRGTRTCLIQLIHYIHLHIWAQDSLWYICTYIYMFVHTFWPTYQAQSIPGHSLLCMLMSAADTVYKEIQKLLIHDTCILQPLHVW